MKIIIFFISIFIGFNAFTNCHEAVNFLNQEDILAKLDHMKIAYHTNWYIWRRASEIETMLENLRKAIGARNDNDCERSFPILAAQWKELKNDYPTRE